MLYQFLLHFPLKFLEREKSVPVPKIPTTERGTMMKGTQAYPIGTKQTCLAVAGPSGCHSPRYHLPQGCPTCPTFHRNLTDCHVHILLPSHLHLYA